MLSSTDTSALLESTLPLERVRLVRLCAQLTGNRQAAEDLAQETLLEAWHCRHKLYNYNPQNWTKWLSGVARNLCLRWMRERQRVLTQRIQSLEQEQKQDPESLNLEEQLADEFDIEIELERHELAQLLDRALSLLPPTTRSILVERYIHEVPNREIAARLHLSEDVVAQRIHRGKLTMRRVLKQEAASYGLYTTSTWDWQETRIWCWMCGMQRLLACWNENRTLLLMRCPQCNPPDAYFICSGSSELFDGVKGFKAALSRVLKWDSNYIRPGMRSVPCFKCGNSAPLRQGSGYDLPSSFASGGPFTHSYVLCQACDAASHFLLCDRLIELPQGQRFWRENTRFHVLPEREVETAGGPAIVTSLQSMTGQARIDFVTARDVFEIISIHDNSYTGAGE